MSTGPVLVDGAEVAAGGGALDAVVAALVAGGVIGVPTDTVYGLAVDARVAGAADRVFRLKRRPRDTALAVLVADVGQARGLTGSLTGSAGRLVETLWPGALTVVAERSAGVALDLGGDPATIGLRCPAHPVARAVAGSIGPFAATSANRHGEAPVTTAAQLASVLPDVALVVDGGPCTGEASTVVDVRAGTPRLLRAGHLSLPVVLAAWNGEPR